VWPDIDGFDNIFMGRVFIFINRDCYEKTYNTLLKNKDRYSFFDQRNIELNLSLFALNIF